MGRSPLWRRVNYVPEITYFKPVGIPLAQLQEIRLSVEEAEAIRLKDLEGLELEEIGGENMPNGSGLGRDNKGATGKY